MSKIKYEDNNHEREVEYDDEPDKPISYEWRCSCLILINILAIFLLKNIFFSSFWKCMQYLRKQCILPPMYAIFNLKQIYKLWYKVTI